MLEAGDIEGAAIWRAIMGAIDELQRARHNGEPLNSKAGLQTRPAAVWTEYVLPKLLAFQDEKLQARREALWKLTEVLLECLLRNPKSENVQILLDLVRSDTTPDEIAATLERGAARIGCDPRPKYFESVDIGLVFTDPLINDVAAARRLLTYAWTVSDGTTPPPDVDRFRHYFVPQGRRLILGKREPLPAYSVSVSVVVPFAGDESYEFKSVPITPRGTTGGWWKVSTDGGGGFRDWCCDRGGDGFQRTLQ